ncbi:O-antigen/teichoic acid export membrane protein [Lachnospiraceae bacterium PF1-22]|uniref:oligosaccharide flippase family protein n=1 Tax=Ohessyouella blattaphilus TaxID=2949333 RepID=UPI003E28B4CF
MADIKKKFKSLLKGGFFHILFGNTAIKMVAFFSSIVIVRLVSKEEYAYLAYSDNLYSYINIFAGLGMSTAVLKFCSNTVDKEEDKAYLGFALKYGSLFQILISIVFISYSLMAEIPFPEARSIILLSGVYPLLMNVFTTIMNYTRAHLANTLYVKMSFWQTVAIFVGSVLSVLVIGINGIVIARYIATFIALIIAVPFLKSKFDNVNSIKLSKTKKRAFVGMSVSLMVASLFSIVIASNEQTLVNYLVKSEVATANYKVANLIPSQLSFVSNSIVVYFFPIVAQMKKGKETWKKLKNIGLLTLVINVLLCIIGIVFTPIIINLIYGSKYADAKELFAIFWIVHAINAGVRIMPMNMLAAIGEARLNAFISVGTCLVHFIVDYFAIGKLGLSGVGIASGIVYFASGLLYWIILFRKSEKKCN